jgi:hypothetical protein
MSTDNTKVQGCRSGWTRRLEPLVLAAFFAGAGLASAADGTVAETTDSRMDQAFRAAFAAGDRLFNHRFTEAEGAGANLSADPAVSVRFSRVPRPDLPGFQADPFRSTGPSTQSCGECHDRPAEAGSGGLQANGIRDPERMGNPAHFLLRNPIHLFGSGALQRLAEEATADLKRIERDALARARSSGTAVTAELTTQNGVNYGVITASPSGTVDRSGVKGMDADLVVKPYFWKGELASFLRALVRGSAALELGLYGVELVGPGVDIDFDGVPNELSVRDVTARTTYVAAQPRPVTRLELSRQFGGEFRLRPEEIRAIRDGEAAFHRTGCTECHRPALVLRDSRFQEPSASADYRDAMLLGGDPAAIGLDPSHPVAFDLGANPSVCRPRGADEDRGGVTPGSFGRCFPQFESSGRGGIVVRLYGDLKRHDLGPALAEPVDEIGTGVSIWKTRDLWGVGNTGPWLHDGRATTL